VTMSWLPSRRPHGKTFPHHPYPETTKVDLQLNGLWPDIPSSWTVRCITVIEEVLGFRIIDGCGEFQYPVLPLSGVVSLQWWSLRPRSDLSPSRPVWPEKVPPPLTTTGDTLPIFQGDEMERRDEVGPSSMVRLGKKKRQTPFGYGYNRYPVLPLMAKTGRFKFLTR